MRVLVTLSVVLWSGLAAASQLAITNVTVIDGTGGPNTADQTVLVEGGVIAAMGPADAIRVPTASRRLDGTDRFLMPGWIDAHIHLIGAGQWRGLDNPPGVDIDYAAARSALHGFLYVGVTSVYDAGNVPDLILEMRRRERAGDLVSPRIFATGHALSWPGSWMAGTFHGVGVPAAFTQMLADKKIPVATTLAVFDEIIRFGEEPSVIDTPLNQFVMGADEIAARQAKGPPLYASMGWTTWFKALAPYIKENVRALYDAGGIVVVATDRSNGPLYFRELEILSEMGIPASDLVSMGTLHGAKFLGLEDTLGTVAVGKQADLVLLGADPTTDIRNAESVVEVIKGGEIIDRAALDLPGNRAN